MSYEQLLEELQTYESEYLDCRELFESDGEVDPSEQAQLDQIESMIVEIRQSLNDHASQNGAACIDETPSPPSGEYGERPPVLLETVPETVPDTPTPQRTESPADAGPPEHRLVKKETFTHKVHLKDTNYETEELGYWLLTMEVGLSGTGQVYPLYIDMVPRLVNPANNIINIFPTITAKSENINGVRSCDITFNVQVAGPNVTSSSGTTIGGSIGWKNKAETLEAGGEASWTVERSHTSQAGGAWRRRFHFSGGNALGFSQDEGFKVDLSGDMVVDDDDGHDQWGPDTDWELHTYDG